MLAGQIIVGGSLSLTVTVKVQLPSLPLVSLALQVTVVVPLLKVEPLAGVQVTGLGPSYTSLAQAEKVTTAEHLPPSLGLVIGAGQLTTGASPSVTVTLNVQLPSLPLVSLALQVTAVVP